MFFLIIFTLIVELPVLGLGLGVDFTFAWHNKNKNKNNSNKNNNPNLNFLKATVISKGQRLRDRRDKGRKIRPKSGISDT